MNLKKTNTVFKNTCVCFLILFTTSVFSQTEPLLSRKKSNISLEKISEKNLLKRTNDFIAKKEYKNALLLLNKHYPSFSESVNVNWLYAHVLSINNDNSQAIKKFKKAINLAPDNKYLEMDYARFLYNIGEIYKSESVMSNFIDSNFTDAEFLLMQANISFWKGDIKGAQNKINRLQEIYPNSDITKSLTNQIKQLTAVYLKANFEYQTDSQPLNYFAHHINISQYVSALFNPKLEMSNYYFSPNKEIALIIKVSNQFHFDRLKLTANLTGGVYKNISGEADWIGGINFNKEIIKNISLNFGYSKSSLLGTIESTTFNLTQQDAFGAIDYNNKYVAFHAAYNYKFFKDDNNIKSISSWVVSQPIKLLNFDFQVGYGYSFTDSKNILFVFDNQNIGTYQPYFTPKEQEIHSALFISNYRPFKKLTLQVKLGYGFIGNVKNPYPLEVTPNNFEIGGFYDETFTPIDINGSINYTISNKFSVNANYTYQETYFYTRNNFNLGLNYTF